VRAAALPVAAALVAVLVVPATADARPLFSGDCVDPAARGDFRSVSRRGEPLDVQGRTEADLRKARDVRAALLPVYRTLVRELGRPLPRFDGAGEPFEVFVTGDPSFTRLNAVGLTAHYCGHVGSQALALKRTLQPEPLRHAAVHELTHAIQSGVARRTLDADWFTEASAEWVAYTFAPDLARMPRQDEAFIQRPVIPLDFFAYNNPRFDKDGHAYGAWRFLQWLERGHGLGRGQVVALLRRIYRQLQLSGNQTDALASALFDRTGKSLPELVGAFWGDHLRGAGTGPPARGRRLTVGLGRTEIAFDPLDALAADVVRIRLAPGVREVAIEMVGTTLGTDGRLWVMAGGEPQEWTLDDGESFCVRPEGPTAERPWLVEFAAAYANGGGDAKIEVIASDQPCRSIPDVASGGGCPPPMPFRHAPAGFTNRLTYFHRSHAAMAEWKAWLTKFVAGAGYATSAFAGHPREEDLVELRQQVRVRESLTCARDRLAAIVPVPAAARAGLATMLGRFNDAEETVSRIIRTCRAAIDAPEGGSCERWAYGGGGVFHALGPIRRWAGEVIINPNSGVLREEIARCARQRRRLGRGRAPRCDTYMPKLRRNWFIPPF